MQQDKDDEWGRRQKNIKSWEENLWHSIQHVLQMKYYIRFCSKCKPVHQLRLRDGYLLWAPEVAGHILPHQTTEEKEEASDIEKSLQQGREIMVKQEEKMTLLLKAENTV